MGTITVELQESGYWTRYPCLCGGASEKDYVNAYLLEDGVQAGPVVCASCLATPAALPEKLRERVRALREQATTLEHFADNLPPLPSVADWETANARVDAEIVAEHPELEEEPLTDENMPF